MSNLYQNKIIQIYQHQANHLQLTIWKGYQQLMTSIQTQLVSLENLISQYIMIKQKDQFEELKVHIEQSNGNIRSILQLYSDILCIYTFDERKQNIQKYLSKKKKYRQYKQHTFEKNVDFINKQEQSLFQEQLITSLNQYQTKPKLFRFCPNSTTLKDPDVADAMNLTLNTQIKQALNHMVKLIDYSFQQYQNLYSFTINDPGYDDLIKIIRKQYQKGFESLKQKDLSPDQIVNMKDIYQKVRATLKELSGMAQKKETQQFAKLKQNVKFQR